MIFGILEKFKNWFRMVGQGTDLLFYQKPQIYSVRYEAAIKNNTDNVLPLYAVLPIPPDMTHQRILKEPKFFPKEASVGKDPIFGNKYAYWKLELLPRAVEVVKEEFRVAVSPREIKIPQLLTLDDYEKDFTRLNLVKSQNAYINPEDERIKSVIREIIGEERNVSKIILRLNEYVVLHLEYGNPITGLYSSKDALEKSVVDCGGFDTLLVAFCIASGISARIISGFFAGYKKNEMHAWLEIMLPNGEWIPADPSIENLRRKGKTKKSGRLGFVGSDRIALSIGCEISLKIGERDITVDILQNPIVLAEKNSFVIETKFITVLEKKGT